MTICNCPGSRFTFVSGELIWERVERSYFSSVTCVVSVMLLFDTDIILILGRPRTVNILMIVKITLSAQRLHACKVSLCSLSVEIIAPSLQGGGPKQGTARHYTAGRAVCCLRPGCLITQNIGDLSQNEVCDVYDSIL